MDARRRLKERCWQKYLYIFVCLRNVSKKFCLFSPGPAFDPLRAGGAKGSTPSFILHFLWPPSTPKSTMVQVHFTLHFSVLTIQTTNIFTSKNCNFNEICDPAYKKDSASNLHELTGPQERCSCQRICGSPTKTWKLGRSLFIWTKNAYRVNDHCSTLV